MASIPFDTSGGPRLQSGQPYNRPNVLGDNRPELNTLIRVGSAKETLKLQYDIARGVKEPFLAKYASFINVLPSTERGVFYLDIIYQRPESQADYEAAGPDAGPAL